MKQNQCCAFMLGEKAQFVFLFFCFIIIHHIFCLFPVNYMNYIDERKLLSSYLLSSDIEQSNSNANCILLYRHLFSFIFVLSLNYKIYKIVC